MSRHKNRDPPSDFEMERYLNGFYAGQGKDYKKVVGHIDDVIGSHLEELIIGHIITDSDDNLLKTTGGMLNQDVFKIKPFKKIACPDFYLPESEIIGDVKRINLEKDFNDYFIMGIIWKKVNECIKHTTNKINDKVLQRVKSDNPKICAIGAMEYPDHRGYGSTISKIIEEGLTNGMCPEFKNIDSFALFCNLSDPSIYQFNNNSGRIVNKLFDNAIQINIEIHDSEGWFRRTEAL